SLCYVCGYVVASWCAAMQQEGLRVGPDSTRSAPCSALSPTRHAVTCATPCSNLTATSHAAIEPASPIATIYRVTCATASQPVSDVSTHFDFKLASTHFAWLLVSTH
ncbi:MAG: hypothetical protein ACK55Z_13420, partial [bacterium]